MDNTYGYVRVSTKEQNEDRQMIAMREFGIEDSHIVVDKQSGKDFERPGYRKLVRKLKATVWVNEKQHRKNTPEYPQKTAKTPLKSRDFRGVMCLVDKKDAGSKLLRHNGFCS